MCKKKKIKVNALVKRKKNECTTILTASAW